MRKIFSILFALVLVLSVSLVSAVPAMAAEPTVTLGMPDNVYRPEPFDVISTTTNPTAEYASVRFNITVSGPEAFTGAREDIFTITEADAWAEVTRADAGASVSSTFVLEDGNFVGYWGPAGGFSLPASYNATSTFTIQMCDVATAPLGDYDVTVELVNLTPDPDDTLATATDSFSLSADTLYVGTTEYRYQFTTIQNAIDSAGTGDTVNVATGTYNETLNIEGRTNISIVGEDKNTTIIKSSTSLGWGNPPGGSYGEGRQTMIRVVGSTDIDFSNFTFDFSLMKTAVSGISYVSGIWYWSSTGTIDNNILKDIGILDDVTTVSVQEHAIYVRAMIVGGYSHAARADVAITYNEFINTGRTGVNTHDYVDVTIHNNLFHKDAPYDGSGEDYDLGYAIEVGSESTGTVTDNIIYGYETGEEWTSAGIYIENAFTNDVPAPFTKTVSVERNEVYSSEVGVHLGCPSTGKGEVSIVVNFSDNNIHDNRVAGVQITDHDAVDGSSVTVNAQNNIITNNGDHGYYIYTKGDGAVILDASEETITNHDYGVLIEDWEAATSTSVYDITIDTSNIFDNTTYGLYNDITTQITATQNWWGHASGPDHATSNPSGTGNEVSDNVDYSPWWGANYIGVAHPWTWYTNDSIQDAIDAADPGDTINVAAGTYAEQLTIDEAVTLNGANAGVHAVTGSRGDESIIDVSGFTGDGIKVTANNVTIDGFEIIGIPYISGSSSSNVNPTIVTEANDVAVQNCVFNTSGDALGQSAMVARPGINHISFLDNAVNGYMFGITARGSGWGGSATLPGDGVVNLTVSGNTFNVGYLDTGSVIYGMGVQIQYGDDIVVTGNTINGPGTFESCIYGLINSIGIADFMSGYGAAGTITYSNNEITNCYVGIGTFAGNGEIIGNIVTGNNIGIQVGQNDAVYISTPATGVAITGNDIQNNIRGIWAQNFVVDGLAAHFNNIVGNTEYGVINEDPENDEFDATCNWWGDNSGPYHETLNPGGTGDAVSDYVDFEPWLVEVPTVTTQAATGVDLYIATLNMDYTVGGYSSVQVRFGHKKSDATVWYYTDWVSKTADGSHSEALDGLASGTIYDFKAQLRYDETCGGETMIEGTTLQFTTATPLVPPSPFCFIATAAYGSPTAEQLDVLREFRDTVLLESTLGSQFVSLYYQTSPPIADFIAGNEILRTLVRELLVDPIVWVVDATGNMWRN